MNQVFIFLIFKNKLNRKRNKRFKAECDLMIQVRFLKWLKRKELFPSRYITFCKDNEESTFANSKMSGLFVSYQVCTKSVALTATMP